MAENADADAKKGPGILGLVKAVAIVSLLVVVQVVAAGLVIPSAQQTENLAEELAAAERGEELDASESDVDTADEEQDESVEVEIGAFSVTRYNPEADKTTNIDFELYATVLAEELDDFNERFEQNRNRVREQVVLTLHGAPTASLTTDLELVKRRILDKTNRALGKPLVRQVLLTRFNFVER